MFALVSFLLHPIEFVRGWRRSRSMFSPGGYPYVCEVCGAEYVTRKGIWDYCPKGHIYVGMRADG